MGKQWVWREGKKDRCTIRTQTLNSTLPARTRHAVSNQLAVGGNEPSKHIVPVTGRAPTYVEDGCRRRGTGKEGVGVQYLRPYAPSGTRTD